MRGELKSKDKNEESFSLSASFHSSISILQLLFPAIISVERECPTLGHKNPGGTKSSHNLMDDVGNVKDA